MFTWAPAICSEKSDHPYKTSDQIFWKPPRPDQSELGTRPRVSGPDQPHGTRPDQTVPDQTEPGHIGPDRPDWIRPDQNFTMGLPWRSVGLPWEILNKELNIKYSKINKNYQKTIKINFCSTVRLEILWRIRI